MDSYEKTKLVVLGAATAGVTLAYLFLLYPDSSLLEATSPLSWFSGSSS